MPKTIPTLEGAPTPVAPYSVVTEAQGLVFISGQVPIDPSGGPTPTTIEDQTELVLRNIGSILGELGLGYRDVVKTTVFLADIRDFAAMNEVYGRVFASEPPARSAIQAGALPAPQYRIEIEVIAAR
ncbi:MAG TPA: RidA family protein [Acidimicrobiia bacterium]|nr:RidA family protein [Acidimicrobiia bacterium]